MTSGKIGTAKERRQESADGWGTGETRQVYTREKTGACRGARFVSLFRELSLRVCVARHKTSMLCDPYTHIGAELWVCGLKLCEFLSQPRLFVRPRSLNGFVLRYMWLCEVMCQELNACERCSLVTTACGLSEVSSCCSVWAQ